MLLHHVETEDVPQANEGFMLVSPDGKYVYSNSNGLLRIFSRSADTGEITSEIATISGDDILAGASFFPRMAAFGPDGTDLYVLATYGITSDQGQNKFADSIMHFERAANTGLLAYQGRLAKGIDFTEQLIVFSAPVVTVDGFFIYAVGSGGIFVFKRDGNGALSLVEIVNKDSNGEALNSYDGLNIHHYPALSRDGKNLYITSLDGKLFVFSRDEVTGKLTALQTFRHDELTNTGGEPITGLERSEGIAVTANGGFVYVSGKEIQHYG